MADQTTVVNGVDGAEGAGGAAIVVHGALSTVSRSRRRGLLLISGALLVLGLFVALPTLLLVVLSFMQRGTYGEVVPEPTLANLVRLCGFESMSWTPAYLITLLRTIIVAGIATVISIALAYPLCFVIAARTPRWRAVLLASVAIPFCTNLVVRTYGWVLLLSSHAPLAEVARWLHLIDAGGLLYPSAFAVQLGMVSCLLPFAVLPLYASVERMDLSLIDAARDLYASRWQVFRHAVLPQTMPGLGAALVLTFIPALGIFLVPSLLGGGTMMLGTLLQQQFFTSSDLPFGATIGCCLIVLTLAALVAARRCGASARALENR